MAEDKKSSDDGCFLWIVVIIIGIHSCGGESTSDLTNKINSLQNRIDKLENSIKK